VGAPSSAASSVGVAIWALPIHPRPASHPFDEGPGCLLTSRDRQGPEVPRLCVGRSLWGVENRRGRHYLLRRPLLASPSRRWPTDLRARSHCHNERTRRRPTPRNQDSLQVRARGGLSGLARPLGAGASFPSPLRASPLRGRQGSPPPSSSSHKKRSGLLPSPKTSQVHALALVCSVGLRRGEETSGATGFFSSAAPGVFEAPAGPSSLPSELLAPTCRTRLQRRPFRGRRDLLGWGHRTLPIPITRCQAGDTQGSFARLLILVTRGRIPSQPPKRLGRAWRHLFRPSAISRPFVGRGLGGGS
jgi:hypothetical protein